MKKSILLTFVNLGFTLILLLSVSCSSTPSKNHLVSNYDNKENVSRISSKKATEKKALLVELGKEVIATDWINKYDKYEIVIEKKLSKSKNIQLISFDEIIITAEKLRQLLQRDKAVKNIQEDDTTTSREEEEEFRNAQSQVLIQLVDSIQVNDWSLQYEKYDLTIVKSISKRRNIHLFSFNGENILAEDMIKIITRDTKVKKVELNKQVKTR